MALIAMLVMAGAVAAGVVNVLLAEVADVPLPLADTTSKSYKVPAVKPDSVTEWLVVNVGLRFEAEPYVVLVP
jgi:hypothetical protein